MTFQEWQRGLIALGYNLGRGGPSGKGDDGIPGGLTNAATREFKRRAGLSDSLVIGPQAIAAMRAALQSRAATAATPRPPVPSSSLPDPAWVLRGRQLLGLREGPGSANNPTILNWADDLDIHYPGDDIAWCGLFVAHCLDVVDEPLPSNPLGARNYLKVGVECTPRLGAIVVYWRGSRSGWQGHVGFYMGEDATAIHTLGGNQGDSVSIVRMSKDRVLGYRWPTRARDIMGSYGPVRLSNSGKPLSTNEA